MIDMTLAVTTMVVTTVASTMKCMELHRAARRQDDPPFGSARTQREWNRIAETKQRAGRWTLLAAGLLAATAAAVLTWLDIA